MENPRGAFKKNERGRGRGGRGSKQSFKASNYRYYGFGPSGVLNGLVVQPSNRRQEYTSHIDRGRYSREAENIAESFPAAQISQSDAVSKDRDLIEAAANGHVASFSAVLKQCVNCTSQNGLDLALLEATKRGYKSIVQQLIRAGARTCGLDERGYTPLMIASEKGYLDIATTLLKKSANISAVSFTGQTALHVAVQPCGASDMLSLLLYHGADVNVRCGEGTTPLMRALELQDLDAVKILIDAGAKLDRYKNKRGETAWDVAKRLELHQVLSFMHDEVHMSKKNYNKQSALMRAAASCNLEAFKLLLDCSYTEVNKTNKEGSTLMQIVKTLCRQTGNNRDSPGTAKRFEMIKLLLQNGAKADDCSTKEGNALILAVKSGQNELVQLLCMSQIKLNYLVNDKTALMIAAEKGHVDIVNTLLNAGADYKLKNSKQEDALLIAFKYGQVNCAKLLLQKRANLNVVKSAIVSIDNNRVSSLQYLLTHHELDVNTKCLLHRAIQQNNAAVVKLLIDKGADVNQLNDSMDSPLQLACNKDVSCVELLIKNGADVNLGHPLSGPPIIRAVPNVAKVLLQHGADVNKASASGETALMQACGCFGNTYDMVKLLLDAGADVNLMSDKGDTCLHYAVSTENIGNIKLLMEYGADVNAVTNSGDTPFLLAAEVGNVEILQLFLDKGAKVDVYDSQGCNALLRAIKMCDVSTEVVRLLAFNKEHLNKQSNRGYTPLMLAAEMVNYELMKTLLELGADVHVVNKEEPRKNDITALSILLDSSQIFKDSDIKCIEELLKYGAMSSLPKRCLSVFHKMIVLDKRRLVQLFVTHGMSPCNVDLQPISFRMGAFFEMQMLRYSMNAASPLSAALASGNSHIARYLAGNWFLTASDLTVFSQCSKLRDFLESISMQDCVDFLEEFTSQPLSLMKLSFVAASAAIGSPPGRQERIMQLPIPSVIKDKLLFKNEEVPMDYGTDAAHNRLGFLDVGINMVDHVPDSPSGVFFDFDDPRQLMYDSDSDLCFSSVMYDDSDDTFMYI